MISCPTVRRGDIRGHYDFITPFYRLLWGRHIHHGLWENGESPRAAQQNLIETLAREAGIPRRARVLDVGCGMGGSSVYLAQALECRVTGVTLSPFQRRWARWASRLAGTDARTEFLCADAEQVDFAADWFDVVWSIECTEHLFDKPRFFRRVAHWLRPGGRVAICAWLAGEAAGSEEMVREVCEGFLCPSLGTAGDYVNWMQEAGLGVEKHDDWTDRVAQTWEICDRRVRRTGMRGLARVIRPDAVPFLDRFATILEAYRTGAMKYGYFVAHSTGAAGGGMTTPSGDSIAIGGSTSE